MALAQDIVVVNEFSYKPGDSVGTRGATPGQYVMGYMARSSAYEDLTPVKLQDVDNFIIRYMARESATEQALSVEDVREGISKADGFGGVAFGCTGRGDKADVSFSDAKLKTVSADIQEQFDRNDKTVMKTVISFTNDYLIKRGIVPEGFECRDRGDYMSNIDQMKLRQGIIAGMNRLSKTYDDLEWVGVIQLDTKHVHCHLCMVDKGQGKLAKDGTQKGKLTQDQMMKVRLGIDTNLDDNKTIPFMKSNIDRDKRNARGYIKKFTHNLMNEHGLPQFILSCLPKDKRVWRAKTNRRDMRKANVIVREFVEEVLQENKEEYAIYQRHLADYALKMQEDKDLTQEQMRKYVENGHNDVVEGCMNAVYKVLKDIPDYERTIQTPMLSAMSLDYEEMASAVLRDSDPMVEFGFKLRSYSNRLRHHKREMNKYHDLIKNYEQEKKRDNVAPGSEVMLDFYREEEDYHARCLCKYQYFLPFVDHDNKELYEMWEELSERDKQIRNFKNMLDDYVDLNKMHGNNMEKYIQDIYGFTVNEKRIKEFSKARQLVQKKKNKLSDEEYEIERYCPNTILGKRLIDMQDRFQVYYDDFINKVKASGYSFDDKNNKILNKLQYDFKDVKALDIHHMSYDFPVDVEVSQLNAQRFIDATDKRVSAYRRAVKYLTDTDQEDFLERLSREDMVMMENCSRELEEKLELKTNVPRDVIVDRNQKTISLDMDISRTMQERVVQIMRELQNTELKKDIIIEDEFSGDDNILSADTQSDDQLK